MRPAIAKYLPGLILFAAVSAAYLSGVFGPLDRFVSDALFKALRRDATGSLVVVEIDGPSLRELSVWPWPRRYHAEVIDRLTRAGARAIAMDIDFSARTTPAEDRALAEAIARARGRVVLPVFRHRLEAGENPDRGGYTQPLDAFTGYASLASVNVYMDADGRVWRYRPAERRSGETLPSFASLLAGESGIGRPPFYVDYGIRLETIPRLSFADVLNGDFDEAAVRGKVVIVGATAVALGDRIPVPAYGIMTGPLLQAMAYESLVQGRTIQRLTPWATLVLALALAAALGLLLRRASLRAGAIVTACAAPAVLAAGAALQWAAPVAIDLAPIWAATLLAYFRHLAGETNRKSLQLFVHRLLASHHRAMLNSVVYDSFDGIVIVDEGGRIRLFNPMAERMLGVPPGRAAGRKLDYVVPEFAAILAGCGAPQNTAQPGPGADPIHETEIRGADGQTFTAEVVVGRSVLKTGRSRFMGDDLDRSVFILTFRDVSERKRTEEAQRAAAQEALAASRAKSEFLANVSHELRTPLNAIIGFSEILNAELLGPIGAPAYREYVTDIHASGLHLLEVINDILDMSKIEAGEMRLDESRVDVAALVRACARLIGQRAKEAGLAVSLDVPADLPRLRADQRLLKQILLNLLSNAVKFTGAGGSVTIRCRTTGDGGLMMSVIDTGIGIAEADMSKVLSPFGQVDSRLERKYEGTGLGLPLVKSMTELHDGRIEIASELGHGTTVTVYFGAERVIPWPAPSGDMGSESRPQAVGEIPDRIPARL